MSQKDPVTGGECSSRLCIDDVDIDIKKLRKRKPEDARILAAVQKSGKHSFGDTSYRV